MNNTKEPQSHALRDPRDQNREHYNPLFADIDSKEELPEKDPQPMTPPYKAPTRRDIKNKGESKAD